MSSVASNVGLGGYIHNQGMSLDSNKNRVFNTKLVISYFNLALGQNTNENYFCRDLNSWKSTTESKAEATNKYVFIF